MSRTSNPFALNIVDLPHAVASTKDLHLEVPAPADLGTDVIGVPEGSPITLDLTLTSVEDGVLLSGSADLHIHGECVRCLRDIDEDRHLNLTDLYYLPAKAAEILAQEPQDGEDSLELSDFLILGDTTLDAEPVLRDALVPTLPFQPLCDPDCGGLCQDCGERWDDLPADHAHELLDPRWAALAGLLTEDSTQESTEDDAATAESRTSNPSGSRPVPTPRDLRSNQAGEH